MAHSKSPVKLKHNLLAVVIFLLAFAFRVVAINQIPAGLSHDEAYNGVTAIQALQGERRIFFEINKGIEPLIIYLEAAAFYLFGIGPVQLRLVNIIFGMLTIALVYPLAARLFNRQVALLAMAALAVSFWAVFVSRLTLRAVLLPPLLLLTLYLFWRGLQFNDQLIKPALFFALSGLAAGMTMYTYLSSRFLPFIIFTVFGYQMVCRKVNKGHWAGLLLHVIIWTAIFLPLATYFVENSESFSRRADQVSTIPYALNGDFEPLLHNTLRTLGMFTFQGDTTNRYNLDGRPVFDWVNGVLFYVGLGLAGWHLLRHPRCSGPQVLLLSTVFFMLIPDFITDDSPHFLRTIGAMPIIYIFWALGLAWIIQKTTPKKHIPHPPSHIPHPTSHTPYPTSHTPHLTSHISTITLILILLTLTALHTAYDYFNRWATAPEARYIYGADIAQISHYIQAADNNDLAVISAEYYRDLDPFRLMLHFQGQPPFVIWFDGQQTLAFPPPESNLSPQYIFAASAPAAEIWTEILQPLSGQTKADYQVYTLADRQKLTQFQNDMSRLDVIINNDLILSGYKILGDVVSGGKFQVLLGWQALRPLPPGTDYTFLVQMRDEQGHLWAQADGNGYAPGDWQPGVQALQQLTLRLPGDLPPRTFYLTAQVVDRNSAQALPAATGETTIPLQPVKAGLAGKPRQVNIDRLPNAAAELWLQPELPALALRGFDVNPRRIHAGDSLALTLHWQVLQPPEQNYHMQIFLTDAGGKTAYQWPPFEPAGGEWATGQWPAEYWVQDKLTLPTGPEMQTGLFNLRMIWVTQENHQPSGITPGVGFDLGRLEIESP